MAHLPQFFTAGMNNVAEFIASGWPYAVDVVGGQTTSFPWVTSELYLTNGGGTNMYASFTADGMTGSNKITVLPSSSMTLKLKVAKLFVSGSGTLNVVAALTNILPTQYPTLSGSSTIYVDLENETLVKAYPGV
jgi:hypothetical protein